MGIEAGALFAAVFSWLTHATGLRRKITNRRRNFGIAVQLSSRCPWAGRVVQSDVGECSPFMSCADCKKPTTVDPFSVQCEPECK